MGTGVIVSYIYKRFIFVWVICLFSIIGFSPETQAQCEPDLADPNLVGYFPLDSNPILDSTGNLSLLGDSGITYLPGIQGNAADMIAEFIDIVDDPLLHLTDYTIKVFVRPNGPAIGGGSGDILDACILNKSTSDPTFVNPQASWYLGWRDSVEKFIFMPGPYFSTSPGFVGPIYSTDSFTRGDFHELVITADSSAGYVMYVNGTPQATLVYSSPPYDGTEMNFGALPFIYRSAGFTRHFDGVIDNVIMMKHVTP